MPPPASVVTAPLAVENFLALCAGDRGKAKGSGKPLAYAGCNVFRKTAAFMQLGDFSANNGAGGESIWGPTFKVRRRPDPLLPLACGVEGARGVCGVCGRQMHCPTPPPAPPRPAHT